MWRNVKLTAAVLSLVCFLTALPVTARALVPAFHYFLVETDGGGLANPGVPEVSILRVRCTNDGDPGGIKLDVNGGVHDPANAVVTITDTNNPGTVFGTATAVPDATNTVFGLYFFQLQNNVAFTVCPGSVTASAPGAVDAVSGVDALPAPPPAGLVSLEGPISAVTDNLDGTGSITIIGVTVNLLPTTVISTPSSTLTIAQLADPTPLPGRSDPGFIGGTGIVFSGQSVGGTVTSNDLTVEPAETVLIGTVTHATCTNPTCSAPGDFFAILGVPLTLLTDPRFPGAQPRNAFGFEIDMSQGGLVGTLASAEGYFGQIPTVELPPAFNDVPSTHPFFNQISAIAAAGITGGCSVNPPLFCPDSPITRGQMAVFLEVSLGVPQPACLGTVFTDVTAASVGSAVCGFIEDLANRGITGGCGGSNFCPNDVVTRGQMAVFIETALGNPANACAGTVFLDVNTGTVGPIFCGFIERLAADGITGGCGGGNFCPGNPVTRGEMAVFIVAAPAPLLP